VRFSRYASDPMFLLFGLRRCDYVSASGVPEIAAGRGPVLWLTTAALSTAARVHVRTSSSRSRFSFSVLDWATQSNVTAPAPETTGYAPTVSKKMGPEMESAGDVRAAPDSE
jgi:hypothetical protein